MGTAAASAGAAGPSEGLRTGRSSGRTQAKPEYTAASGRRDHATFGSRPTHQSDDRDSEPDYLLGTGRVVQCLIIAHSFLVRCHRAAVGTSIQKGSSLTTSSSERSATSELVIKEAAAFAASSAVTHIPCAV